MKTPNKLQIREGERLSRDHVKKALAGILRVEAFIHRVRLSANDTTLDQIVSIIGPGKPRSAAENKSHHNNLYNKASYHSFKGFNITLNSQPNQGFLPKFMLSLTNHKQSLLYLLSKGISNLKMSSAEYTIDIHCKDKDAVSMLFYVLRRYMYFPYRQKTSMVGGDFSGVEADRRTNAAYFVWQRAKGKKDVVIYERGDDNDYDKKEWAYESVNRVRIEFLARSKTLAKHNINYASEFVKSNMFSQIAGKRILFKEFCKSSILPKSFQDYNAKDKCGNIESFQEEYQKAKVIVINASQYIRNAESLDPLKERILSAIDCYESAWARKFRKHVSRGMTKTS